MLLKCNQEKIKFDKIKKNRWSFVNLYLIVIPYHYCMLFCESTLSRDDCIEGRTVIFLAIVILFKQLTNQYIS